MDPVSYDKTWLCPTPQDRARVLDMERRLKPLRLMTFGSLGTALLVCMPWAGWWPLPLLAGALAGFLLAGRAQAGLRRPEYAIVLAWSMSVVVVAIGVLETGGLHSPAAPWLAIPAVALAVRFRVRGVVAGSLFTAAVVVAIGLVPALSTPRFPVGVWVVAILALLTSNVGYTLALLNSDLHHRGEALIDQLTGMLNRNALQARVAEMTEQARINEQPVALIVGDLDHFKAINDRHGHAVGDAVLAAAAYRIRKALRAYDLAYRLGGEEFLVVLPGGDPVSAVEIAENLRRAIEDEDTAGVGFTMSFGVSASTGGDFDFPTVFAAADDALYVAKRAGRNRVHLAGAPVAAALAA